MPKKDSKKADKPNSQTAAEKLRSIVDRIVRLEEEKASIANDIKEIYAEAKSQGYDPKSLRNVVKDQMKTEPQRAAARETEEITDVYRAALGLLGGRPLDDAARDRFNRKPSEENMDAGDTDADKLEDEAPGEGENSKPEDGDKGEEDRPQEVTAEQARQDGRDAQSAGRKVTSNPFQAGSAQRAAWDEGWCEAAGSDGMDIPEAWRRRDTSGSANGRKA